MFSKKERLSRSQFETYFKTGKKFHQKSLTLVYTPSKQLHTSVVVGKKVAKKAHERNILRRRVYGQAYRILKGAQTGVFIFITKPSFFTLTKNQQREEVQNILKSSTLTS